MITHYFRTLKDEKLKEVHEVRTGVWTHAEAPTEAEIEELVRLYALDSAIVADARDLFEVPRFERSGGVSYFFTRYPFDDKDEVIDSAPLLIVVGESFVLTIAQRDVPFLDTILAKESVYTTQKGKLFLQFMSRLTKAFDAEIVRMRSAVHRDRVHLRHIGPRDIQRLVGYENALNEAIAAIVPTNAWLRQLSEGNYLQLYDEDVELMEDLMIDNSQLVDSSKMLLKTIQNIRGATEAILTQKLNSTIQILTVITVILTVPTLIGSLYGMNVALPFQDNPHVFWAIVVIAAAIMLAMVQYFKQKRWF